MFLLSIKGEIVMFRITEECISCGTCAANCPAGAINAGDTIYEIDQEKCEQCGLCAMDCPCGAIVEE